MYVSAIVVAAGRGRRFGHKASKAVVKLNSRPAIVYSLAVLNAHPQIKEIIIAANPANIRALRNIIKLYKITKATKVILGGKERRDSVANGLQAISPQADFVLIHDAARPFITKKLVTSVIEEAARSGAAIAAVAVKATIKKVAGSFIVEKTLDRKSLWEAQTPQVFKKDLILKAYKRFKRQEATDDAMLAERLGAKVSVVPASYSNIKITTPEDLLIAKGIAEVWKPI
jgi:2-C-methyl-D-erythritol 4-phosphate cytidylyltransferase